VAVTDKYLLKEQKAAARKARRDNPTAGDTEATARSRAMLAELNKPKEVFSAAQVVEAEQVPSDAAALDVVQVARLKGGFGKKKKDKNKAAKPASEREDKGPKKIKGKKGQVIEADCPFQSLAAFKNT
jgi:hypothetical protein